ncbi:DegV family protein [Sporomusa acidovorans]|uniref:Protein DegV n=1 Tax=Sporomusa acidovorans (strain ATCC 49682 / DSM 3132 / Mol) TaxID=1123286 RepID=A0ABZ3J999_SPOA4|nr:DegV family protein [Sporomusa acidovorans]OZC22929.1 fatty acid-binding protein [Sporomusa acidovorans DSM 3132]SDE94910.1 EDD domain protein, DegV family [Sporomusa acidovorans]
MLPIHIVIDSTANVPGKMLSEHPNLHVVPLKLILGEDEWSEPELTTAELFRLTREKGVHPRTSQPSPGEFIQAFAPAAAGEPVIMICLTAGLSGTFNGARTAARDFKEREIYVIDSCTGALGSLKMAEQALAMASAGNPAQVIAGHLRQMAAATRTLFIVDSLDYLHKGGRIGGAAALFGSILQIKPILTLRAASIQVLDKVRTRSRAIARMLEELDSVDTLEYIGVVYGDAPAAIEDMVAAIRQRYPGVPVSTAALGSVIAAHLGPGVIGLIFQSRV